MSDQSTAAQPTSRSVAILGADALLVALPSTPTQLANACFAGGFAEVFPATWGDELIAAGCLEQVESRTGPAIFCACPLVAEQLRGAAELRRFIVPLISPPVAVARYLRALFPDDSLLITYIGDCPGADDPIINERLSPHELLANLAKRGIMPATQRPDLGAHIAHDRRRFYSIPGGVPSPQWLGAQWPKRTLVDVHAGDALATLASQTMTRGNTLIDFAPHLGCACAGAVGGTSAQDARAAVVALEPPRAQTEIVDASVRVEVSLAAAGDHHLADVTWNDFLAALPAALAMHPEGATARQTSRTAPRRVLQRKVALPRAYIAARRRARRERSIPVRSGTTQELKHAVRPKGDSVSARETTGATLERDSARREEITAGRPNPWVARRASHEGMTGPRGVATQRAGLATADRWLIGGLMLVSSVLVAVLTSALTVRGMERTGRPLVAPTIVTRAETTVTVAAAPVTVARDTTRIVRPPRLDSVGVASVPANSAPQHEDGGAVAPPPSIAPTLSPMPVRSAHAPPPAKRSAPHVAPSVASRFTPRAERRALAVAEHTHTIAQPATSPSSTVTSSPLTAAITPPAQRTPQPSSSAVPPPVAAVPAAPAAANNAQVLEELRAIHAEIDARRRHVDSLAAALDSLKRIKP